MDPSIWSNLPDELFDRILSLLPLRTLLSLRPTCKRFSSLLQNPSFLSLLHNSSSSSSFLLLSHPQFSQESLPLYDSHNDTWRTISLPSSSHRLLSSSNGLLLFSAGASSSSNGLLLSNLLTNSSATISCPTQPTSSVVVVSVPSNSNRPHGYRIFLPCPNSNWVHLYSSASHSWTRFPGRSNSIRNGVFFDGLLYFTTPEPFSILGLDVNTGNWGRDVAPELPGELTFVRLLGGGERLFLVGGIGRDGISRSLAVWELLGGKWEEVGTLPELMCRKFVSVCYHNYSHVYCLWQEGMVCVCCTTWPEVLFFKLGRRTWHWLSRCPLLQSKWSCGFRWFAFSPDLYALV